jgi:hypothetical protein
MASRDGQFLLLDALPFLGSLPCKGDFSVLAARQCISAHSSCAPLTFAANGEILILSNAEQFCPVMLTLFSPCCAFIHLFTGSCLLRIRNS